MKMSITAVLVALVAAVSAAPVSDLFREDSGGDDGTD